MPVKWLEEVRPCPVCRGDRFRVLGARGGAAHHLNQGVQSTIVRCGTCHAVYPRPFLIPDGNPYSQHSHEEYFERHESIDRANAGEALARRAMELIDGQPRRLLELGCGGGDLLVGARRLGWTVRGVEMTEAFARHAGASGLDVEAARVETCRSLDEQWECVLLAAVLEHLYEPRACLDRVFRSLAPGGVAFIDVPNECSLWARLGNAYMRLRGRPWAVNLSPTFSPYHVVGFCPRSLRWVLNDLGFEIVEIRTHRWPNALPADRSVVGLVEKIAAGAALSLGSWIGEGAGITAWVRRPRAE